MKSIVDYERRCGQFVVAVGAVALVAIGSNAASSAPLASTRGIMRASAVAPPPRVLTEPDVAAGVSMRLQRMNERHQAHEARRRDAAGAAAGGHGAVHVPAPLPREPVPLPPDLLDDVNQ